MTDETYSLSGLVALVLSIGIGCGNESKAVPVPADPSPAAAPAPAPVPDAPAAPAAAAPAAPAEAAEPAAEMPPGDAANGKLVYAKSCVACHAADGRGNGGITGADLIGDKTRLAKSDAELFKSIKEGVTGKTLVMPPHKDLISDAEISDAVAYVRTLVK